MSVQDNTELLRRMKWVIDNRFGGVERQWAIAAKLTPSHVTTVLRRLKEGRTVTKKTIDVLAEAGGVHGAWLFDEKGPRDLTTAEKADS